MIKLIHGDCLEKMKEIKAHSVNLILTDPPYFLPSAHYSVRDSTYRSLSDLSTLEYYFSAVFKEVDRLLDDDGHCYMFCDGQSYPIFYVTGYRYFKALRPLIWDKIVCINGYAWRHQHEIIIFGERENAKPIKTGDGDIIKCRAVPIKERIHLAEKPLELLKKLIDKIKPDIICDPFMGSGSTGEAAKYLGYDFIGIEKDLEYFNIAKKRIAEMQLPLKQLGEE